MSRLAAQQEVSALKEQLSRVEKLNEDLEREVKTIPAIAESNDILKGDLMQLRQRFKEEKTQMVSQLRALESSARDVEALRGDVKHLAMR